MNLELCGGGERMGGGGGWGWRRFTILTVHLKSRPPLGHLNFGMVLITEFNYRQKKRPKYDNHTVLATESQDGGLGGGGGGWT